MTEDLALNGVYNRYFVFKFAFANCKQVEQGSVNEDFTGTCLHALWTRSRRRDKRGPNEHYKRIA